MRASWPNASSRRSSTQHVSTSGRIVPELADPKLREVIDAPYRIVYRVRDDVLEILTVVHSAPQVPTEFLRAQP